MSAAHTRGVGAVLIVGLTGCFRPDRAAGKTAPETEHRAVARGGCVEGAIKEQSPSNFQL